MAKTSSKEKEKSSKSKAQAKPGPVAAVSPGAKLGQKRTCPKCSTKFYDFCKEELHCPKCNAKLKSSQLASTPHIPRADPKKAKIPEKPIIEVIAPEDGAPVAFESIDDLGDDDTVVEDIAVDDDDGNKADY